MKLIETLLEIDNGKQVKICRVPTVGGVMVYSGTKYVAQFSREDLNADKTREELWDAKVVPMLIAIYGSTTRVPGSHFAGGPVRPNVLNSTAHELYDLISRHA